MSAHVACDRDFVVTVVPAADAPSFRIQALGHALEDWSTRELHGGVLRWADNFALLDLCQAWEFPCATLPGGGTDVLTDVDFVARGDFPNAHRRLLDSLRGLAHDFADVLQAINIDGVASGLV